MSPDIDKDLITRKLALLDGYIDKLEPLVKLSVEEILKDDLKIHTAERMFQLIVDEIIDINTHIIRAKVLPAPDDIQGTFTLLGDKEILPIDFTVKIAPIVGLRNAIVHRYEHVSIKLFLSLLKDNFNDFKKYSIIIAEKFLKK